MSTSGTFPRPEESGSSRRGLFARREAAPAEPLMTPTEFRLAETLQRAVDDRLEDGLRTIEEQATGLMREVATEVWRSSAKDVRPEQERIVSLLSRDQAIRSLIASSDERFQALAVRTARLEDHLNQVAETNRTTREAMEHSARSIREIADSPSLHGVEAVRTQLEQVERHIASAFAHMDERDEQLTQTVLGQVREHGELIARETTRIVESMQNYVQGGAEAMGQLAQRIEQHAEAFGAADGNLGDRIRELVQEQTTELTEQLAMVSERVGLHGRNQQALQASLERAVDIRARGLAELVRADSEALRKVIEERAAEGGFDETVVVRAVDERMSALEGIVAERMGTLERTIEEQVLSLSTAMTSSIERNMERMATATSALDGIDTMLAESLSAAEERMLGHIVANQTEGEERMIGRVVETQSEVEQRMLGRVVESQTETEERMQQHLDDRITAIARLIRSDNQALAQAMAKGGRGDADQEASRDVLRAVKELQAGLATDVLGAIDRRFEVVSDQLHKETQSTAEAMLKLAEVVGDKLDRLSTQVDEGVGGDIQIVVDRMSDAIQALSAAGRREPRVDIG